MNETASSSPDSSSSGSEPAKRDQYKRRFGEVAIDLGLIASDQLVEALTVQAERQAAGKPIKLLGQILLELGFLTPEQIQEVVDVLYPPTKDNDAD